jgi:hypothetical protein
LIRDVGIHDHFLVFAAIKAVEAWQSEWLDRHDDEYSCEKQLGPRSSLFTIDIDIETSRRRRQRAVDVWREVALPILEGSVFDAP